MMHNSPEMPQHLVLALDRHRRLLEEAQRYRQRMTARKLPGRLLHWHWLRLRVGELLIFVGQWIKPKTVTILRDCNYFEK